MMWQPHWVIAGIHVDDGVVVLASDQLSMAEIKVEYRHTPLRNWAAQLPLDHVTEERFHFNGTMLTLIVVHATDYASALKHLFEQWRPDEDQMTPPPPVGAGPRPELPRG